MVYPIKQQLLVAKKDRPIRTVYSHPQALAQGKAFLRAHYPDVAMEMTASTAYAARYVAEHPDLEIAAIALWQQPVSTAWKSRPKTSKKSRTIIHVLDFRGNRASDLKNFKSGPSKVSLALTLPSNLAGALYKGLSTFAWRGSI